MNDSVEKVLPFNKQAEEAVVGACVWEPSCIGQVITIVKPEHFFSRGLGHIYGVIVDMYKKDEAIDALLVQTKLQAHGTPIEIGEHYIEQLAESTPTVTHVDTYATIIAQESIKRTAIQYAHQIQEDIRTSDDVGSTLSDHIRSLESISQLGISDPVKGFKQLIQETNDFLERKHSGQLEDDLIPTGLIDLDHLLHGGLRLGHFDILAARPAMGKTSLAVQMLLHNAMTGNNCLFFSIEMPDHIICQKAISTVGRIKYKHLDEQVRDKQLEWGRIIETQSKMSAKGEVYTDMQTKELNQTIALIRKYVRRHNVKFVVIDYLQLMSIPGKYGTRDQEIGHCVNELAYCAKILNINVLCLSQLNRSVEGRESKVPLLSDLRESGNIEQSAWRVLAIHRDEYYDSETERQGLADIHVLKGKISNVGKVTVRYDKTCTRFDDLAWQR